MIDYLLLFDHFALEASILVPNAIRGPSEFISVQTLMLESSLSLWLGRYQLYEPNSCQLSDE